MPDYQQHERFGVHYLRADHQATRPSTYGRPIGYSVYPFREGDSDSHGHSWPGLPAYGHGLFIGCADNAAARRAMAEWLPGGRHQWLNDAGNDTNWGQVLVGSAPRHAA